MKYPQLIENRTSRSVIDTFRGYNHNLKIADNEFFDMKNMTSSHYPILSPRPQRGQYAETTSASGLIEKDSLCHVDNGTLYINKAAVPGLSLSTAAADNPKTLISFGAYIIIMPDKKYINTVDLTDYGSIEANFTTGTTVTYQLAKQDGTPYDPATVSDTAPANPSANDLWIDTSSTPHTLKIYSDINDMWTAIVTTYIKILATNIGKAFETGDGVTISGSEIDDLNNTMVIQDKGDDYIVVIGIIDNVVTQSDPLTVDRRMPQLDFICESENRLWGCRYGTNNAGDIVNEIYASKLGDFKNWNCFTGISTDSYIASVGTDGQFTGAIAHLGYPLFFKENCVHKVYGNFPSNFQIQTTTCRGVQKGSSRSLVIVNEILYYKSKGAVCSYDGSLPAEVSAALGDKSYSNAVAGAVQNKYYISMMDDDTNEYVLFAYDTRKGMWHKEDDTHVIQFCTCKNELYYIPADLKSINTVLGSGTDIDERFEWYADTGIIGIETPDKKYVSRIDIRLSAATNTLIRVFIDYDSSGVWQRAFIMSSTKLRNFNIPICPRRCDHLRLRIEGHGEAKIFSVCKTIEQGSSV